METNNIIKPVGKFGSAIGKGLLAGLAGTVAITVPQMIEMKITRRKGSTVPADAVTKALDIKATTEADKKKFSQQVTGLMELFGA